MKFSLLSIIAVKLDDVDNSEEIYPRTHSTEAIRYWKARIVITTSEYI
jgi:hypothetical protein